MTLHAPKTLDASGLALWRKIIPTYELRPDERETLEDVCKITDVIAALEAAWIAEDRPMTTRGSMGQLVIHPIIGELRTQRLARNVLWRQLKLPDLEDAGEPANQHRTAGQARWRTAHGAAR